MMNRRLFLTGTAAGVSTLALPAIPSLATPPAPFAFEVAVAVSRYLRHYLHGEFCENGTEARYADSKACFYAGQLVTNWKKHFGYMVRSVARGFAKKIHDLPGDEWVFLFVDGMQHAHDQDGVVVWSRESNGWIDLSVKVIGCNSGALSRHHDHDQVRRLRGRHTV